MEILFWLAPIMITWQITGFVCLMAYIVFLIVGISHLIIDEDAEILSFLKKKIWIPIVIILVISISSPLSRPFEIYKQILIYRGIESETADKLIEKLVSDPSLAAHPQVNAPTPEVVSSNAVRTEVTKTASGSSN